MRRRWQVFDKVLALRGSDAGTHYNRGNALKNLGRYAEALASYERALALTPGYVDALYNRGNTFTALARHQEALADYDKALALRPRHVAALNRRGNAACRARCRPDEALPRPTTRRARGRAGQCRGAEQSQRGVDEARSVR